LNIRRWAALRSQGRRQFLLPESENRVNNQKIPQQHQRTVMDSPNKLEQHTAMDTMNESLEKNPKEKMPIINRHVQALFGLYSRVARQLKVDRSYVSRVARGERHSTDVESALSSEFNRIINDDQSSAA
jgi:hypothetical protein